MNEANTRYGAIIGDVYRGSFDLHLISSPCDDSTLNVPKAVGLILEQCTAPRTLEEHRQHLMSSLGLDGSRCSGAIETLVQAGLLVPWPTTPTTPRAPSKERTDRGITALGIVTADRAALLQRALSSYVESLHRHGHELPLVVVDASRHTSAATANLRVVEQASQAALAPIVYIGAAERKRLRGSVVASGCSPDVMAWILPEPPDCYAAGAARNLMLLSLAGTRFLTVDDDTVCTFRRPRWFRPGAAFGGHTNLRQTEWFVDRATSTGAGCTEDVDLVALHGTLLGLSLHDMYLSFADHCEADDACSHVRLAMSGVRHGRIRSTWSGVAGDGAQYCQFWNLFAQGATRERMASSDRILQQALSSREVLRAVPRFTVTDESALMTYCAGLDAVDILPPFNPRGFNEDGLFGGMLRLTDPEAFIGELPMAIVHDSPRQSPYLGGVPMSARQVRLTEIIMWLLRPSAAACVTRSPALRMRWIGNRLREVGELDPTEFRRHLKRVVMDAKWSLMSRCETLMSSEWPYPEPWRSAIRQYREAVVRSLSVEGFFVPVEYHWCSRMETALLQVRDHVVMFGKSLQAWPDIWRASGEARLPRLAQLLESQQARAGRSTH